MFSQFDQVEYCNVDSDNLDRYCFYPVLEFVVSEFLSNKALLLPDLYKKYEDLFDKTASQSVFFPLFAHDMKKIKHDSNWLFRMLKCSLGPSLLHFVPRQKKMGRMLYRNGTNLLECLHLALVEQQKVTSELKANNDALARKIGSVLEESSVDRINYLDNSLKATSQCVKSYVSSRVKTSGILEYSFIQFD